MIEFIYPWMFLLLPLPILVYWFAPEHKESKDSLLVPYFATLVELTGEKPQTGAVLLNRKHLQRIIVAISWACIVCSLAKPEFIGEPITKQQSARDLMIAVDLSGSMAEEDFTTENNQTISRLTAVKLVLSEFAKQREHDRLGLILFGNSPYLQAPFTSDIDTWLTLLNESDIGMAGQSTAFGDAVGLAISVFKQADTDNRVLIVLTDGNDTASKVPPVEAAKVAISENIKIYTIAIGDPEVVGENKVDLDVLINMAEITNGKSFQALNRAELSDVYQNINELEPQLFDSKSFRPKTSAHFLPLAIFTSIYLIALIIITLRFQLTKRRGLNE